MSTIEQQPPVTGTPIIPRQRSDQKGGVLAGWLSSTDHKVIGYMYLITSFGFFLVAGYLFVMLDSRSSPGLIPMAWQFLATIVLYPFSQRLIDLFEDADVRFR